MIFILAEEKLTQATNLNTEPSTKSSHVPENPFEAKSTQPESTQAELENTSAVDGSESNLETSTAEKKAKTKDTLSSCGEDIIGVLSLILPIILSFYL